MKPAQTWQDHNLSYPLSAARMTYLEERMTTAAPVNSASKGFVNVTEYGAVGNGITDDTAAFKNALAAGKEGVVFVPPAKYQIKESLVLPTSTALVGADSRTAIIEAEGNIKLLMPEGQNLIGNLFLKCSAEQASGAAIDCSGGKPDNLWIEHVQFGSNFFNGVNLTANSGEFGGVHLSHIHFAEFNSAVKGYKGAGIKMGSTTVRTVGVFIRGVHMQVATQADMVRGIQINNTDSLHMSQVLLQNPKAGLTVGDADTSAKLSTNLFLADVQSDGCLEGFKLENMIESAKLWGCNAEACGTGIVIGEKVSGAVIEGCSLYHNESHGIFIAGSASPKYGNSIVGCAIQSNGENAEATIAGINFAESSGGYLVSGNSIGNAELVGGKKQKFGIVLGKKTENIGIYGNRFQNNVTEPIKKAGEEVNINGKNAPTFAELETVNFKTTA